jgi:hypothetical protein
MNRIEFLAELNGITGTIESYTRNPYVMGYLKVLEQAVATKDTELEQTVLRKLIAWYEDTIDEILDDRYVYNKDLHKTTQNILNDYLGSQSNELCLE